MTASKATIKNLKGRIDKLMVGGGGFHLPWQGMTDPPRGGAVLIQEC